MLCMRHVHMCLREYATQTKGFCLTDFLTALSPVPRIVAGPLMLLSEWLSVWAGISLIITPSLLCLAQNHFDTELPE